MAEVHCATTEPRPPTAEPSLTSLVAGIVNDAQQLMKQELALAKVELKSELKKTTEVAMSFGAGIAVAAFSPICFLAGVIVLITWASDYRIPYWGSCFIIGFVLAVIGGILIYSGRNRAEDIHLVPRQTVDTLRENVQWIKTQT
jgi:uncharacterized membrane protein YqjE